ncbi:MAG: hypothetical protein WDO16_15970 [Bacteroidota bacterium]
MIRMVAISFLLHVYGAIPSFAQADRWIWLGENILTQFERDTVITDNSHHMLSGFLDYRVRSIAFFGEFAEETTNRAGIILKAKSTTKNYKSGRAVIGKETDSCLVAFNIIVDEITHGRSAATSVGNLFSRKENKDYQDAPYSTIGPVASSGYIQYNTDSAVFSYTINYKKDRKKTSRLVGTAWRYFVCKTGSIANKKEWKNKEAGSYICRRTFTGKK